MKKYISLIALTLVFTISSAFANSGDPKLVTRAGHISFKSYTKLFEFTADNYKVVSILNTETGKIAYSVTMQCFEFSTVIMQKKFNTPKYLDTKQFPKAKFVGVIDNMGAVDFNKDGEYEVNVRGDMTIRGQKKAILAKAKIIVDGAIITVQTDLQLTLADFGILFKDGKPAKNIAKVVDVSSISVYTK